MPAVDMDLPEVEAIDLPMASMSPMEDLPDLSDLPELGGLEDDGEDLDFADFPMAELPDLD